MIPFPPAFLYTAPTLAIFIPLTIIFFSCCLSYLLPRFFLSFFLFNPFFVVLPVGFCSYLFFLPPLLSLSSYLECFRCIAWYVQPPCSSDFVGCYMAVFQFLPLVTSHGAYEPYELRIRSSLAAGPASICSLFGVGLQTLSCIPCVGEVLICKLNVRLCSPFDRSIVSDF